MLAQAFLMLANARAAAAAANVRGIYRYNLKVNGLVDEMDARWKHPWTSMICGPTSCGKTVFVMNFLKYIDDMSDTKFDRILLYYTEWQPIYKEFGDIEFHEGLPKSEDYAHDPRPKLLILDDLMRESSSGAVVNLFTKGSHHNNLSVIFISQNLFHRGQREISLNSNYIVIFKNPRDRAQVQYLARQLYPEDTRFFQDAYLDATSIPHGYLLVDLKQNTPENVRVRTCIFPFDEYQYVYVPRRKSINSGARTNEVPVVRL